MLRRTVRRCIYGPGRESNSYFPDNYTTLSNKLHHAAELGKWNDRKKGIPQKPRDEVGRITVLHESPRVMVAGRNRVNNFNSNQYLVICRSSNKAVMVDAADDWMDDWSIYLREAGVELDLVFLTHLHIDNIIGLHPLSKLQRQTRYAWSPSDEDWIRWFPRACARYGRTDMQRVKLPIGGLEV